MQRVLIVLMMLANFELATAEQMTDEPFIYTIEEAVYDVSIKKDRGESNVLISGRIISGDPVPIHLLGRESVITRIEQIKGGTLISDRQEAGKAVFLPDGRRDEFQVALSFLLAPREDSKSRLFSFTIPAAIRNSLRINVSPEINILEKPGIPDTNGICHFSATNELIIRFTEKKDVAETTNIDLDSFSNIKLQSKRAIISTMFAPVQPLPGSLTLKLQENTQYISSSLKKSWINRKEAGLYEITIPENDRHAFTIQFATDEFENQDSFTITLPQIINNNGKDGAFVIEEPDDCQISIAGEDLVRNIPAASLSKQLLPATDGNLSYMRSPSCLPVTLDIKRFKSVSTPPIVLDTQYFFMSFEENGNLLSVISMDLPAEAGPRLELKIIPDTQIWSLTVNGKKRKIYTADNNMWIVPLENGGVSQVQLALLRKADKLGLQGRLEFVLPETGLPSRNVRVAIGLPERVQLLSLEGPVSPDSGASLKIPLEFAGKPHFFSRSFYKGQEMKLAIAYKEPVREINK